jgi:hypothetical protein
MMLSKLFKRKTTEYTVYAILGAIIITLGIGIFWSVEDPTVLTVKGATVSTAKENITILSDIPIRPSVLKPGGIVFMRLDYCKHKNVNGVVTAKLIGEKFTALLTWPNDETRAGCVNLDLPIPIPDDFNDDTYYVEFETLYHVNPVKDRTVILRSDTFKVAR